MFDRQLDVFGDEHDVAPAHERMRLFEPVRVMPGQTGMRVEDSCNYCERFDTDRDTGTGRCILGTGCNALDSETIAHGIA